MNPISSSSLFHFTTSLETLFKILTNGFRYSYAFERFSSKLLNDRIYDGVLEINQTSSLENCGIAIPMVSFCDIPITRTLPHAERYGKYFIGFNKGLLSHMLNPVFNPVIYGISSNLSDAISFFSKSRKLSNQRLQYLFNASRSKLEIISKDIDLSSISYNELLEKMPTEIMSEFDTGINGRFFSDFLLALYKPVNGMDAYGNECCFYDEREWRAVIMNGVHEYMPWHIGCSASEYLKHKDSWNDILTKHSDAYITLPPNILRHISHIGVKFEDEVEFIADFIMNDTDVLFGYNEVSDAIRLELISKITSFERIENNY